MADLVYKRPNSPYWYYDITDPKTGQRQRRSTKRETKREALEVARNALKETLDQSQLGVRQPITLEEAAGLYLQKFELSNKRHSKRTVGSRVRKLTGQMEGRWGFSPKTYLHDLSQADIEKLKLKRIAEGAKPETINAELRSFGAIVTLARSLKRRVPSLEDFRPKQYKTPQKLRFLTVEEERKLLAELDPDRPVLLPNGKQMVVGEAHKRLMQEPYDLAVFLLDTGARYGEVASLTWDMVDTIRWKWINIYREKVGNEGILTMTHRLRDILQRRFEASKTPYIFPGRLDRAGSHRGDTATKSIRKAIARAGLNPEHIVTKQGRATVHTLRDTFASRLVQQGLSLFKVQKLLGHTTPIMTQKYAKLEPTRVSDEAAAILDQIHEAPPAPTPEPPRRPSLRVVA